MGSVAASCFALRREPCGCPMASALTTHVLVTWSGSLSGSGQVGVVGHSFLVTSPEDFSVVALPGSSYGSAASTRSRTDAAGRRQGSRASTSPRGETPMAS